MIGFGKPGLKFDGVAGKSDCGEACHGSARACDWHSQRGANAAGTSMMLKGGDAEKAEI